MVDAQLEAFRRLVLASPDLQLRLRAEADLHDFVPLVVDLGVAHGFAFSDDDVREAMIDLRRAWLERWVV